MARAETPVLVRRHILSFPGGRSRPFAGAVDGDRETRHRGHCAAAGVAGGRTNPGARRIGCRRCHRSQRGPQFSRTYDERTGRRSVRFDLGCEDGKVNGHQRQRLGAQRP